MPEDDNPEGFAETVNDVGVGPKLPVAGATESHPAVEVTVKDAGAIDSNWQIIGVGTGLPGKYVKLGEHPGATETMPFTVWLRVALAGPYAPSPP